ncbi:odorant receptor 4-like [Aphidius gifuensis]|uniref:odorant receptor 4-like n=1 Tax=Aphidius gifuensis TaxID=684658 RepID=UPI001CDCC07C|nr:odorant receptor 4-like [Aphidius gifuensis]
MDIEIDEKKTWSKDTKYALGLFKYLTKCLGSWPLDCYKSTSLFIFCSVMFIDSVLNHESKNIMKKFAKKARKVFFYQISFCVIGNVGNDCYFFGMAMHLCGQLVTLQLQTKDFGIEMNKNDNGTNHIRNFVKKHKQIMNILDCLKDSFNFILIVQLANNAFSILLMGIQMILNIQSGDNVMAINAIVIILVVIMQLFLYCHAGEELKHHSESLTFALFECSWYNMPIYNVKSILFIMMRTSKTFNLTAGSIYHINMDTFTKILKAMGSYFSVLQALFIK